MDYTGGDADASFSVYFFGDQTSPFEAELTQLLHVKTCEVLSSFFDQAHYALRLEISRLQISRRASFPRFTCIIDLLARKSDSGTNPALELALLCLTQLARFIRDHGDGSRPYPNPSETAVLGLCTGSFAAAAISTSTSVFELLPVAVETVLIAFRTGLRSIEVRDDIERGSETASPVWSVIVGMHEDQALKELSTFSAAKGYPSSSRPYLSAINPTSVTVSGPPKTLDALLQKPPFTTLKLVRIPIHAPYHAAHLYGPSDVDAILKASNMVLFDSLATRIPFVSCSTGKVVPTSDYASVIRTALQDILIEQLRWDKVLKECGTWAVTTDAITQSNVYPILGTPNFSQSLAASLKQILKVDTMVSTAETEDAENRDNARPTGKVSESKIAIVGYSGRFPDAESNQKFWDLLHKGLDVHREIPQDRFDVKAHFDPTGKTKNTSRVQYGCFINEPGLFDARFFNMSPREAANTDPGQRLAITTAYEALEMAGFVPDRTPSSQRNRVGTFYGMTSDDWREVNSGQNVDTYFIPGGNRAFTPGRINYHFKFSGPSFSVDTACSSSFAAIHTACNSLWRGDCDTAIAGGTNVMTNPDNFAGLDRGHFLSTTGNCNTFDDNANGYCRADAVGTVILKRLEDAEAEHDPIYGVLLGAYTNHSAEADSMTRPHSGAQAFIFDKMLRTSNKDPLDVSYIEMHGTGTQRGDAVEMNSVLDVFAKTPRGSQNPLHLGSAKANVGHAESASGVTSLIKVLLMLENNEIPPHCGIKTKINHNFPTDLKARNVNIALEPTPWNRPQDGKRTVFMNNFSAAGGNTALLMEDASTAATKRAQDNRSYHLVAVSAKSITSLQHNIQSLVAFIDDTPDLSLSALSYTLTARRIHHSFRAIVAGHDLQPIQQALRDLAPCANIKPVPTKSPDVAFVFTGQGSIYSGMARELFESVSSFQEDIRRLDNIAQSQGFPSFLPLIDGSLADNDDALSPVITQVGAACTQIALARLWTSWGVTPSAVVGHSLGEYAAFYAAGVLSISDAIFLTGIRAQMLEKYCSAATHAMLAVKSSLSTITPHLAGKPTCEVACINGPNEIVISGNIVDIDMLSNSLTTLGVKCVKLEVPFAFHSAQVEPILEHFESAAQGAAFETPAIPLVSPLLQDVVSGSGILNSSYLRQACREPVNFVGGIESARAAGVVNEKTLWVEIGAHPVCSGLLKSILGPQTVALASLRRNGDTWKTLSESIASLHRAGIEINWDEYHRDFEGSHEVVKLPAYSWDNKNHWIQYSNNFCLTKGDSAGAAPTTPPTQPSAVSTTSVQRVIDQSVDVDKSTVTIESDLSEPTLARFVNGHKFNGAAVCSSSLYADIALTIGDYLLEISNKKSDSVGMAVSNMAVGKSLIATERGAQLFRASASADWKSRQVNIQIYSVTKTGEKTTDHANCVLSYASKDEWLQEWRRNSYLIRSRIGALRQSVVEGESDQIKHKMAYKLFSALVDYSQSYQGMQEILLDSAQLEATARVKFQTSEEDGTYYLNPYWIDSFGQLAGFVMNGNDGADPRNTVYVNHGWESMRCATRFSREKTYQTYVRMQNIGGTMHAGDVYIFEEDNVVAIYQGIKVGSGFHSFQGVFNANLGKQFQGVPRRALDYMLPSGSPSRPPTKPKGGTITQISTEKQIVQREKTNGNVVQVTDIHETMQNVSSGANVVPQALGIVAEEIGLAASELAPTSNFADLGVDSLLTLTMASRLREELEVDVPSSLFVDCPTVKDLIAFLGAGEDTASSTRASTLRLTPQTTSEASGDQTDETESSSADLEDVNVMATIRCILAEEIGIPANELKGPCDFGELGLDSLLSLTVLARLREEVNLDLPGDLFGVNNSLDEVEAALGLMRAPVVKVEESLTIGDNHFSKSSVSSIIPTALPKDKPTVEEVGPLDNNRVSKLTVSSIPRSSSLMLQGNPKVATKTLFLFPDGSGSATSYAPLPPISSDIVVYGLNCPYMMSPENMQCSLEELTPSYLAEVRRRQPQGPYYLGGWSAGGISAFDAAQELDRCGETVARLILIDSPFPIGLEKLPPRLYDFFSGIGLFGSPDQAKPPPKWLIPHFLAFVDALDKYRVKPFAIGHGPPKTYIVWARDGVCKNPGDPRPEPRADDPREMNWLLNNRTDFGPNGWDALLGGSDVIVETLDDANHFTLMQGQKVLELARFVEKAML
ncbi:MAG: hypothetical protein Q9163_003414 [Psora crenata]